MMTLLSQNNFKWALSCLGIALFLATSTALCGTKIQVRLFDTTPALKIKIVQVTGGFHVNGSNTSPKTLLIQASHRSRKLVLKATDAQKGVCLQAGHLARRCYPGTIIVLAQPDQIKLLNLVDEPAYVENVIASEVPVGWSPEVLKAQAVLTQTRLLSRHPKNGVIELSDSTQDERYTGFHPDFAWRQKATQASRSVWGEHLAFQGKPVQIYYHAACGGHTSDDSLFTGHKSFWSIGVPCPYCANSPFQKRHVSRIPKTIWEQNRLPFVILKGRDQADRPLYAIENGLSPSAYSLWIRIGQALGWDKLPGTRFSIVWDKNGILLSSNGAGHGVGLCQWGAQGLAKRGKSYREILRYYFPKVTLSSK